MNIKEIFKDQETKIFIVTNEEEVPYYEHVPIEEEMLLYKFEKTDWQIIPENFEDTFLISRGYVISQEGKILEEIWVYIGRTYCQPELVLKLENDQLIVEYVYDFCKEHNVKVIPAVASEFYGDLENYWIKNHPQVGIQVLKDGLKYAKNPFVIYEHLTYIYDRENLEEDFIVPGEEPDEPLMINNEAEARAAIEKYSAKYKEHQDDLSIRMSNRYAKKIYAARVWLADRGLIKMRKRD